MSLEINTDIVDFDENVSRWVNEYKRLKVEAALISEQIDVARSHVEAALGDHSIGTIAGEPVIRFAIVESQRLDVKKAREILPPQVLDLLMTKTQSRRFTLITGNETY